MENYKNTFRKPISAMQLGETANDRRKYVFCVYLVENFEFMVTELSRKSDACSFEAFAETIFSRKSE